MSLGPFPILLIPSTKNGKLQFWNDLTQQIIEADFSRPDTDATSGATVMRNGQLIELAEDEPDWYDADGCPVVKMRPQSFNLMRLSPSVFLSASGSGQTVPGDGLLNNFNVYEATCNGNASLGLIVRHNLLATLIAGESTYFNFYYKTASTNITNIVFELADRDDEETIPVTNNQWHLIQGELVTRDPITAGQQFVDLVFEGMVAGETVNYMACLTPGATNQGLITPTEDNTILTRSANSLEFTDLINKGINNAANQFSILLEIGDYTVSASTGLVYFGWDESNVHQISYVSRATGLTIWRIYSTPSGSTDASTIKPNEPVIIILNGTNYKMVKGNGDVFELEATTYTSPINKILSFGFSNNITGYTLKRLDFVPIALTEAEAVAALSQL
jgi:hypothetical protein